MKKTFEEINEIIKSSLGEDIIKGEFQKEGLMPFVVIDKAVLTPLCQFLYSNPSLYFDFLQCITGIDNGPEKGTIDLVYNVYSIPFEHSYAFKIELNRNTEGENIPEVESIAEIWRTANWLERETYDLVGVFFKGHTDLRRILLPADWEGFPLRKDYHVQDYYHEIRVKY